MDIIYQTDRLYFIRPNINYLNDYLELVNDPFIYQYITSNHTDYTEEMEIDWINRHQNDYQFTLIDRNTNEFIGNCGYNEIEDNRGEIGIILNPNCISNHYGREAICELIRIGFEELNLDEVYLVVFDFNTRARRCYEACGFREYERSETDYVHDNQVASDIYMHILRN